MKKKAAKKASGKKVWSFSLEDRKRQQENEKKILALDSEEFNKQE